MNQDGGSESASDESKNPGYVFLMRCLDPRVCSPSRIFDIKKRHTMHLARPNKDRRGFLRAVDRDDIPESGVTPQHGWYITNAANRYVSTGFSKIHGVILSPSP